MGDEKREKITRRCTFGKVGGRMVRSLCRQSRENSVSQEHAG